MAQRRMFSLTVVDTDGFLDLPASSQCLYFHLGMRADDDGFVSSPRKITAMVNCSADDLKLLIAKGFVIPFESGVCVIRDWRLNNYIQSDRYHPTRYTSEKCRLSEGSDGAYLLMDTSCIHDVSRLDTEVSIVKDSIVKDSIGESMAAKPRRASRFSPPSVDEVERYCKERGSKIDAQRFVDFYTSKGWKVGNQSMKDWKAAVRTWEQRDDGKKATAIPDEKDYFEGWGDAL